MQQAQAYYEGQLNEVLLELQEVQKQLEFAHHNIEGITGEGDKAKEEMDRAVNLAAQKMEDLQDKVTAERKDLHIKLDQLTLQMQ